MSNQPQTVLKIWHRLLFPLNEESLFRKSIIFYFFHLIAYSLKALSSYDYKSKLSLKINYFDRIYHLLFEGSLQNNTNQSLLILSLWALHTDQIKPATSLQSMFRPFLRYRYLRKFCISSMLRYPSLSSSNLLKSSLKSSLSWLFEVEEIDLDLFNLERLN